MKSPPISYLTTRVKLLARLLKLRSHKTSPVKAATKSLPKLVAIRRKWDKYAISTNKAALLHLSTKQKQKRMIPLAPIPINQSPSDKWKIYAM